MLVALGKYDREREVKGVARSRGAAKARIRGDDQLGAHAVGHISGLVKHGGFVDSN